MHSVLCLLWISVFSLNVSAQLDEREFFNRVNSNYYALELTELKNFSSWITSNVFEETTTKLYQKDVYPLELIWVNPNDTYFIRRPLPPLEDSLAINHVRSAQSDLQEEFRAVLMNWSRFYAGRLLREMPADYVIESHSDTVLLKFFNEDELGMSETVMLFGQNGLVLKITTAYQDSLQTIEIYPEYKYTGEYWLCKGWQVQIAEKGEVTSGFHVKVISKRINKYWLPSQFQMTLQSKEEKNKLFIRVYNFKNILINRDIQILNRGS
jgi:hypothetical protein